MNTVRFDSLKEGLLTIESKIRVLVGADPECLKIEAFNIPDKLKAIGALLSQRQSILNQMLLGTDEEKRHLNRVNDYLLHLRTRLQERVDKLSNSIIGDYSFDDDYNIEGYMFVSYNDESSVLSFDFDELYGSDFKLMICTLDGYYYALGKRYLWPTISAGSTNILDDGVTWAKNEMGIIVCRDLYELLSNRCYSIPDVIRLNDFWAEATLTCQSITTQSGERFTVIK